MRKILPLITFVCGAIFIAGTPVMDNGAQQFGLIELCGQNFSVLLIFCMTMLLFVVAAATAWARLVRLSGYNLMLSLIGTCIIFAWSMLSGYSMTVLAPVPFLVYSILFYILRTAVVSRADQESRIIREAVKRFLGRH